MSGLYLLRGTDVDIVNKLERVATKELTSGTGIRVEIAGAEAFEIRFESTRLHIHPTPGDVCSRVCSLALTRGLFLSGIREIKIDTFVAPYLERALERVANSATDQNSTLYVCFQTKSCKYTESAAIVRTMLAIASAQKQSARVTVAVCHHPCACAHAATECHQFQAKLWALATREFYAACKNPEYAVIHEFVDGPGATASDTDQAAKNEIAFAFECHALVPAANWSTIGPHRIAFPPVFTNTSLEQHTGNWSPAQWRVARALQVRMSADATTQPYFRTLVPLCGTITLSHFETLRCGGDAIPIAMKLLEHRAWSECVTLCVDEDDISAQNQFDVTATPRLSRLCVNVMAAKTDHIENMVRFLRVNRNTIHTLELSLASSANLAPGAMNALVAVQLARTPDVRHLIISGPDSKKTAPLVSTIIRSLSHATLRELTLPISSGPAQSLATMFERPATSLPALRHLNLVLDADLRGASIEQLFPDPVRFPNVRQLTGVSIVLTHHSQQAAVALLVRRFALGLPHLRSLEVRVQYAVNAPVSKDDYAIATAISESAPSLRRIERLVLDTPISPALLLNLIQVNPDPAAVMRLRTLCVNIHGAKPAGAKAHALLYAIAGCGATLRELKINGEFIDDCDSPSLLRQAMGFLHLSTLDLSECKLEDELAAVALDHGPLNASRRARARVCACLCLPQECEEAEARWKRLNMERPSHQLADRQTVFTRYLVAYLNDNAAAAAIAGAGQMPLTGELDAAFNLINAMRRLYAGRARDDVVLNECEDGVRFITALRHFDRRFGCNVPLLFEFIGSSPDQIPREFDPSPARLHGADLIALLRLMRL